MVTVGALAFVITLVAYVLIRLALSHPFGPSDAWILVLAVLVNLTLTVIGIVRAGQARDWGWLIGTIVAMFFGAGWILAIAYMASHRKRRGSWSVRGSSRSASS